MSEFHFAVVSDVHLGHRKNDARFITNNLKREFPDDAETAALDAIFIAGDLFDRLLTYDYEYLYEIEEYVTYKLKLCKKHDIALVVLKGTRSHDWDQSEVFTRLNQHFGIGCKVEYVDKLSISVYEQWGISILYVPDNWDADAGNTLAQVKELMRMKDLQKVDYAIMHGHFHYQVPEVAKSIKNHDQDAYLGLVDRLIFNGHDHHFSQYDRCTSQGSFDRLAHGEEGPKGHVRVWSTSRDDYRIVFKENIHARIFKTIPCTGLTLEASLLEIEGRIQSIPDGSFVRVQCDKDNPITKNTDALMKIAPMIEWSIKVNSDKEKAPLQADLLEDTEYKPMDITPESITHQVLNRLKARFVSSAILERVQDKLLELK